jgi:hypothetical protein
MLLTTSLKGTLLGDEDNITSFFLGEDRTDRRGGLMAVGCINGYSNIGSSSSSLEVDGPGSS